ncbi:MAG: hypothetical protein WC906_04705 [Parcubacteria group bacterium]|jgi:hypothetical protein
MDPEGHLPHQQDQEGSPLKQQGREDAFKGQKIEEEENNEGKGSISQDL